MIRFRLGQTWKSEGAGSPVDSFGVVLDGVDVLSGASEESLTQVVPDAMAAVHSLVRKKKRFAQFSLAEAHLEVLLRRTSEGVSLSVVSLGRPARWVRGPLTLDLHELAMAAAKCGAAWIRDLEEHNPKLARAARSKVLRREISALGQSATPDVQEPSVREGFGAKALLPGPLGFGFTLFDAEDLLPQLERGLGGALQTLMTPGEATIRLGDKLWTGAAHPFLFVMELSRQGEELSHALEMGEPTFRFEPGGVAPKLTLRVDSGKAESRLSSGESTSVPCDPRDVARSMFELGLEWSQAITRRHRAQAKNPYVIELVRRCKDGLKQFRKVRPAADEKEARAPKKKPRKTKPIAPKGKLRKLQFSPLWDKHALGGESSGRLLLGPRGPVFSCFEMACAFTAEGELLYRRVATHGVAASADGKVITASVERIAGFEGDSASARWLRDHDALPLGPELEHHEGVLVAQCDGRGAVAFSATTGRELWRLIPPRTQRTYFSVQGHRGLLSTDSGYLYGIDLVDGQVRYRMRSAVPFIGPTVPFGKKLLAMVGRAGKTVLFCADAHSGGLLWTQEFDLDRPSLPIVTRERIHLSGEREGQALILALDSQGSTLWERPLHAGRGPFALSSSTVGILVTSASGEAELLDSDGQTQWRLGAVGPELPRPLPAIWIRGVALLPGGTLRAVEPKGGRVLSEIELGAPVVDLKVDGQLNLYVLDEDHRLRAYRLATHLAVVNGGT
jgi:outer membrane protein assembly factor BamB